MLSYSPPTLTQLLANMTPNPHPSGDMPADTSQLVPLSYYTQGYVPPEISGATDLDNFIIAEQQIFNDISANSDARPAYWGENVAGGSNQYRIHLDDNGMLIESWSIDFGDGSDPQTVSPTPWVIHQYPTGGNYTITVTAQSPDGSYSTSATSGLDLTDGAGIGGSSGGGLQVSMSSAPPTLHVAGPQTVAGGQAFALDNLASFSSFNTGDSFSYTIDWADGSTPFAGVNFNTISSGGGSAPLVYALASDAGDGPLTHVFTDPGTYYVVVTVTDDTSGLSDTQTIPVTVQQLVASIGGLPTNNICDEGTPVTLTASADPTPSDPVAYSWQISDSEGNVVAQGADPNLNYTFTYADTYTVSLVASLDGEESAPATATITVNNVAPSFVLSTLPDLSASVGQSVTLPSIAFTDPGLSDTHAATIDWGDTVGDTTSTITEPSADGASPGLIDDSYAYAAPGSYTATVTLTDDSGAFVTKTFNVDVVSATVALTGFAASGDGSQLQVSYTVANADAAPFNINVYTSPDGSTPDQLLTIYPVTASGDLTETSGTPHTVSFTPQFDDIQSNYHLIAVCDANPDPTQNTVEFTGGVFYAQSVTASPPENILYVFGRDNASDSDTAYIKGNGDSPANSVVFNGTTFGYSSISPPITGIHVRGEAGNDDFEATQKVSLPLWLFGGNGTNTLVGGSGNNVIVGGSGQNSIHDGNGLSSPQIVDSSDTQSAFSGLENYFQESGDWATDPAPGTAYNRGQQLHTANGSTTGEYATWTFANLDPTAYYEVYVTWSPEAGASTAAPFSVYDNGTQIDPIGQTSVATMNQTQAPADYQTAGVYWDDLGVFQVTSGTLAVRLNADADSPVLANAAMIVPFTTAPLTNLSISQAGDGISVDQNGNISVTYTIDGEDSPPFSIGIYGSPDGVQPTTQLQSYEVDDSTLLTGGATHTVTFPVSLDGIASSQYVIAQLDSGDVVQETSKADNISAALSGIFEQSDGTLVVLGNATSLTNEGISLTQDLASGNFTVNTADDNGNPLSSTTFSGITSVIVNTPGGNSTLNVDPSVTVPVAAYLGPGSNLTGATSVVTNTPQVMIDSAVPVAWESGGQNGAFTVTRVGPTTAPLIVDYTVTGTAAAGTNYATLSGFVYFSAGASTATINVVPTGNGGDGSTIVVNLVPGSGYSVGSGFSSATVTINQNTGSSGSGAVSASIVFFTADGTAETTDDTALVGDVIPLGIGQVSGNTSGKTFTINYDSSLITVTENGSVVPSGSTITLTTADTIYDVTAADPSNDTPVEDEIDIDESGGCIDEPVTLCSCRGGFGRASYEHDGGGRRK